MRRFAFGVLALVACTNFDALYDACVERGGCVGDAGTAGGGGGSAGGSPGGGSGGGAPGGGTADAGRQPGEACTAAGQCGAGAFCTSGFCCVESAATCNTCRRCDATGRCNPIVAGGAPVGGTCLAAGDVCQDGTCNGDGGCGQPDLTPCGTASCVNSGGSGQYADAVRTQPLCAGGACSAGLGVGCGQYTCNDAGTGCRGACTRSTDCLAGAWCDRTTGTCTPRKPLLATCLSDEQCQSRHCVMGPTSSDLCGECRTSADCSPERPVCSATHTCVGCLGTEDCSDGGWGTVCTGDGGCQCNLLLRNTRCESSLSCTGMPGVCACGDAGTCGPGTVCTASGCRWAVDQPCLDPAECAGNLCQDNVCQ